MKTGMRLSRPARNWWAKEYKGASTVIDFCRGRAMQDGRSVPVGDLVAGHSTNYSVNGIFIGNGDAVRLRDPSILSTSQGTLLIECCQTFNPHSCIIDFGDDDHAIEVGSSATHVDHFNGSSVMTATAGVHNIHFMSRIALTWGPGFRALCFNGGPVARDYQGGIIRGWDLLWMCILGQGLGLRGF